MQFLDNQRRKPLALAQSLAAASPSAADRMALQQVEACKIALAVIGGFVLKFGRLGEGFKIYYDLTIRFKDASGLLKGSDVVLSGAKIGRVSGGPRLLGEGVAVPLRIYEYVKLPKGSQFTVGSSGLLGDRFVNVITPPGPPKED